MSNSFVIEKIAVYLDLIVVSPDGGFIRGDADQYVVRAVCITVVEVADSCLGYFVKGH